MNPRIVCAAIRGSDGTLILGIRHYSLDMHMQIAQTVNNWRYANKLGDDQGFVDQYGRYHTREQAWHIATANGQVTEPIAQDSLYSEDLY